jgi:hypothetical protein
VHGYLTQGGAIADAEAVAGIPTDGTSDYRTLALQFRYDFRRADTLVVQIGHERLGRSPFAALEPEVKIDWAFYERRFGDGTALRVGKVLAPLGIYNEIRDVGTLLPFYQPPAGLYGDGTFTTETVDGVALSHRRALGRRWSGDLDAYYGGFDLPERDPETGEPALGRGKHTLGAQAWLDTPLAGLRVGAGAFRFRLADRFLGRVSEKVGVAGVQLSVDATRERWTLRAEAQRIAFAAGGYRALAVQAGAHLTDKLSAHAQADVAHLEYELPADGRAFDGRYHVDYGAGLNFAFRSELVLKLEAHHVEGYRLDAPINLFAEAARDTRYAILSLSATF